MTEPYFILCLRMKVLGGSFNRSFRRSLKVVYFHFSTMHQKLGSRWTCKTSFKDSPLTTSAPGFDPNCLPNKFIEFSEFAYEKAFNKMEDAIFYRHIVPRCLWKLQKWLQIGQEKKFNESQKMAKGKEQIDDKFLRDTAINLQAAGRDTISAGLRWLFWLVSTHPLVEAKILEEIKDNFKTNEENCLASGVKGLDKLVYLHGAICEAFRLFPPVPFEHKLL
ncbi:hypothetical protein JHK82_032653 [Glycine max]|nr:hypothetical protein JHK86_032745 [Glycine max]KAG5118233.1 hypothetical protein JHK82_032653 [Glycine max]